MMNADELASLMSTLLNDFPTGSATMVEPDVNEFYCNLQSLFGSNILRAIQMIKPLIWQYTNESECNLLMRAAKVVVYALKMMDSYATQFPKTVNGLFEENEVPNLKPSGDVKHCWAVTDIDIKSDVQ